jgi:hypothetical protein
VDTATEFSVDGLPVDARNASFPEGQAADSCSRARVEASKA